MSTLRPIVTLLVCAARCAPAAASAQDTTALLEDGGGVSHTPPVMLGGGPEVKRALPTTGSEPGTLFLGGVALTLLGVGLRLRTADADDH